jgi:thiamine biosynthesis protein ThiI
MNDSEDKKAKRKIEYKYNSYILRYSEIALKGNNRIYFEKQLINNIKQQVLSKLDEKIYIKKPQGRFIIDTEKKIDLSVVFGISSYSRCICIDSKGSKTIEEIKKVLPFFSKRVTKNPDIKNFRISCQRLNKDFPLTSMDFEKQVGSDFHELIKKDVKLKNPDYTLIIEIVKDKIYITDEKKICFAGLPVGIEGILYGKLENIDDLIANFLMMKRGCSIVPFSRKNVYKNSSSEIKYLLKLLQKYSPEKLKLCKIDDYSDLENLEFKKIKGFVTGKTIENYEKIESDYVQLTPIIFYTKEEIKELFNKILS